MEIVLVLLLDPHLSLVVTLLYVSDLDELDKILTCMRTRITEFQSSATRTMTELEEVEKFFYEEVKKLDEFHAIVNGLKTKLVGELSALESKLFSHVSLTYFLYF